jgi:hypothetical protein
VQMWPGWAQSRRRCGRSSRTHRKRRVRERSSGSSPRPSAASTSSAALPNAARHAQASRHDKGRGCAPRVERVRGAQARRSGWAGWDSRCDARAVSNRARAYAVANAPGAATYFRPQSASRRHQPTRPATLRLQSGQVSAQMLKWVGPVPAQMWQGKAHRVTRVQSSQVRGACTADGIKSDPEMRVGSQQQTAMNRIGCCLGTWGGVVWSARAQRRRCQAEAPPPGLQTSRAGPSRGCPSAPSPARVGAHRQSATKRLSVATQSRRRCGSDEPSPGAGCGCGEPRQSRCRMWAR